VLHADFFFLFRARQHFAPDAPQPWAYCAAHADLVLNGIRRVVAGLLSHFYLTRIMREEIVMEYFRTTFEYLFVATVENQTPK
jgi:hypothetical protein